MSFKQTVSFTVQHDSRIVFYNSLLDAVSRLTCNQRRPMNLCHGVTASCVMALCLKVFFHSKLTPLCSNAQSAPGSCFACLSKPVCVSWPYCGATNCIQRILIKMLLNSLLLQNYIYFGAYSYSYISLLYVNDFMQFKILYYSVLYGFAQQRYIYVTGSSYVLG